jgi:hypothetical protein
MIPEGLMIIGNCLRWMPPLPQLNNVAGLMS